MFTDDELATIFGLVRREAIATGYGTRYHDDNKSIWSHRQKTLWRIARKIHDMRGHYNGKHEQ